MFSKYFENLEKELIKKYSSAGNVGDIKPKSGKKTKEEFDEIINAFDLITPASTGVSKKGIADEGGYRTDTPDFIAFDRKFKDTDNIFTNFIPAELVRGAFHVCSTINPKQLGDCLDRISETKKIDQFVEGRDNPSIIPCFMLSFNMIYEFSELKKVIMDMNSEKSIGYMSEVDILLVFGKGLVIKDWHSKGNYIALETGKDSLKWFFILMNEYLSIDKNRQLDLRMYIDKKDNYPEY